MKVFSVGKWKEWSQKNGDSEIIIELCRITWVKDVIGKSKEEIEIMGFNTRDEWFVEKEEDND